MINIAKLLKDAPKGMKLYSPLFGEVKFKYINGSKFGIVVEDSEECCRSFDKYGRYFTIYNNAECLLFPSKDYRTWEGWTPCVEPKFKVGDWLYSNCNGIYPVLVTGYSKRFGYQLQEGSDRCYLSRKIVEDDYHLWTIQDAKDGDVITNGKLIVIFNKLEEPTYKQHIIAYVGLDLCGRLQITKDTWQLGVDKAMPATSEQRVLLFKKLQEAGYQWYAGKKELKKIQVKPMFKVGDWITNGTFTHCIVSIVDGFYYFYGGGYLDFGKIDGYYHLWTIADAKDGDVLVDEYTDTIGIFEETNGIYWNSKIYCAKSISTKVYHHGGSHHIKFAKPATKEQRDLFFAKIKEGGYEWDAEKKELHKIKHYDISSFYAGMPVLVRILDEHKWCYLLFSHCYEHQGILHFHAGGAGWLQCIPFNDETKHLLGTTDMCDEQYVNW